MMEQGSHLLSDLLTLLMEFHVLASDLKQEIQAKKNRNGGHDDFSGNAFVQENQADGGKYVLESIYNGIIWIKGYAELDAT